MTFYAAALESEIQIMSFGDMPQCPAGASDRVLHARIARGEAVLMASDTMPGMAVQLRTHSSMSIDCTSAEEVDRFTASLGAGATIAMPPQDMFWGAL
jgi:PhnB protein